MYLLFLDPTWVFSVFWIVRWFWVASTWTRDDWRLPTMQSSGETSRDFTGSSQNHLFMFKVFWGETCGTPSCVIFWDFYMSCWGSGPYPAASVFDLVSRLLANVQVLVEFLLHSLACFSLAAVCIWGVSQKSQKIEFSLSFSLHLSVVFCYSARKTN